MPNNEDTLTPDEITRLTALLKKLEPGFVPYPIFEQFTRIIALPIIEFIPLRLDGGTAEVLLLERPQSDTLFAGMLHTPGTVIRATDVRTNANDNWKAFDRILNEELEGAKTSNPYYVGSIFHASKRGAEQAQLYWVEVLGAPKVGAFYPVDSLPDTLIESQKDFIMAAVQSFKAAKHAEHTNGI
ncbi:MAG: hypothetical protein WBP26_05840 [Candidatus Saccharimonadales bacterium]